METPAPTAPSPQAPRAGDGFDTAARDFSRLGGATAAPEPAGPASATSIQGALDQIMAVSADDLKLQQVQALVAVTPNGAAALDYAEQHGITTAFGQPGQSTYTQGQILLDPDKGIQDLALSLVHELNHVESSIDGTTADVFHDTREDYVAGMLEEETRGTVESIEFEDEFARQGEYTPLRVTYPAEARYDRAYNAAVSEARRSGAQLTDAELHEIGRRAGYQGVAQAFESGAIPTSNTHEPYPVYYGRNWDERH